jgi:hypothetical protein
MEGNPLDRLPPIYRRVHLAAQAGASDEEIARKEGIRLKAVGNILGDVERFLDERSPSVREEDRDEKNSGALDRLPPIYRRVHAAAQDGEDEEEIARREGIRVKGAKGSA